MTTFKFTPTTDLAPNVQISASPSGVEDGVTPYLIVKCTADKPIAGTSLLSIIISRQALEGNTQSTELASINLYDGGHVRNIGHTTAALTGTISATDASDIAMSFSRPTRNETGLYVCQVNLMDELGHPKTLFSDVLVQEEMTQLQQYTHTLQDLGNQVKGAVDCCSNLNAKLDDLELTATRLTDALEYVQKAVMFEVSALFAGRYYYTSKYGVDDISSAESSCEVLGGYLAEIQDAGEWAFVNYVLKTGAPKWPNRTATFLGAQDAKAEGSWFWTQSKTPLKFTAWESGFPDDVNHTKNCLGASFTAGRGTFSWNDVPCDVNMQTSASPVSTVGFLCEVPI
ncbi:C-type lectin [Elysia marginata]|uniref:C-type lectin n=1 Tax=Elysia marginata TaxID=1093978 RepID=A0AAV4INW6_9GAST|nr:C-type lectin [Elysia marginata]